MVGKHFYNQTIKNTTAIIGSLFNNLAIKRKDGNVVPVPIAYGPRQKWIEANKELDPVNEQFESLLPRMSYEMVAMNYDTTRKLTNNNKFVRSPDPQGITRQNTQTPVPYTIDYTVYLQTKNLNDGWQVIEQILPFFQPAYTVKVRHFPDDNDDTTPTPQNTYDMPIVLSAVTFTDAWTGDIGDRRSVEWTLELSTKIFLHGPIVDTSIILDSRARVIVDDDSDGGDGIETGYANIGPDSDTPLFDNEFNVTNLFDSDGNVVRIIRDIEDI